MSADNWAECPLCYQNEEADCRRRSKAASDGYGKVTASEYAALLLAAEPRTLENSLREDYGIGVNSTGEFSYHYSGSCSVCGFATEQSAAVQLPLKPRDGWVKPDGPRKRR